MPRDFVRRAFCAEPGIAKSHKNFSGLLGLLVSSWFKNKAATIAGALAILIPIVLLAPCFGVAGVIIGIIAMLQEAKEWYYHQRLLCVDDKDNCVIGSVIHEPKVSFDGDRKMDMFLAPYAPIESMQKLCLHFSENTGLLNNPDNFIDPPFFNGEIQPVPACNPDLFDDPINNFLWLLVEKNGMSDYLKAIKGKDPEDGDATANMYNNFLIGYMDRLLDPANTDDSNEPKNFQGRYWRKDPDILTQGSPLWEAIPPDYDNNVNWQNTDGSISPLKKNNPYEVAHQPRGLNPMFRFDDSRLLPYLHCEIDGNYISILLDQLSITLTTFGIAYTFVCLTPLGPLGGLIIGAILAALIFLIQWLLDGGKDAGEATEPDVDFDGDVDFGDEEQQLDGDLVAIYGPWIMDTEHAQYFEIHPVKAYYVLGRNGIQDIEKFDSFEEMKRSGSDRLKNQDIDVKLRDEICGLINKAEKEEIPGTIERKPSTLLSYGLTTQFGGGGIPTVG